MVVDRLLSIGCDQEGPVLQELWLSVEVKDRCEADL